MKIAIDIRSLQSGQVSGVENYTAQLVEHLLKLDSENSYTLFYNSLKDISFSNLHFVNSKIVNFKIPNKFLNLGVRFFGRPHFEKYFGKQDVVFMPNLNHISLSNSRARIVVTVHDLSAFIQPEFFDFKRRMWHKLISAENLLNKAEAIICVSEHTKQDVIRMFGINEDKVRVIYPGVLVPDIALPDSEMKLREIRNQYGLPGKFILFTSTLEPRKNILGLIEAFERLRTPAHLVIMGKAGWKYDKIFNRINSSTKKRFIKYLGYVHEAHKPYIMKLASVVAYPSFYEGFGFVPLEAMSLSVPVVAGSLTSLPEVLSDAAMLVNPYDTRAMSFGLEEMLVDDQLRERFIERGNERVQRYNWEKAANETLLLFKQLKS